MFKETESASIKVDEESFNLQCNMELRTSQLQRLMTAPSKKISNMDRIGERAELGKGVEMSESNFGMSYQTSPSRVDSDRQSKGKLSFNGSVKSTGGPKVKTGKPYCALI